MKTSDVMGILSMAGKLLDLHDEDSFKAKAYDRAARALKTANVDLKEAAANGTLTSIQGIGKALATEIAEIVETGKSTEFEQLKAKTPPGLLDVFNIRGLGAKKIRALYTTLGIESLGELEYACRENRIATLSGFGEKTQVKILQGIEDLKANSKKFRINTAEQLGEAILPLLRELPSISKADTAGRLRRGAEEYERVNFVVEAELPANVEKEIAAAGFLGEITRTGEVIEGLYDETYRVSIDVAAPGNYYTILHQRSAPNDYRFMVSIPLHDRGYELTLDGLYRDGERVALEREEELYELAEMQYIPVEMREGIDEVRQAINGTLPELVTMGDMKGALHVHSTWSDGRKSIAEIAEHVRAKGYSYLLMCDHSKLAVYANGLDEKRLEAQGKEIDELNKKYNPAEFRVLKGIECDILNDGQLDLADDALAALDAVVISVHSNFSLPMEAQTERICRAVAHPYATILGHPTGRLILSRKGYDVDLQQVIAVAQQHGKVVELNANPYRLDLNWRMVRHACRKGVKIAINPDAHTLEDFDNVPYGVKIGRKGWLQPADVINTMTADQFVAYAAAMRSGR